MKPLFRKRSNKHRITNISIRKNIKTTRREKRMNCCLNSFHQNMDKKDIKKMSIALLTV